MLTYADVCRDEQKELCGGRLWMWPGAQFTGFTATSANTDAAADTGEMYVTGLSVQDPYDGHELTQRLSAATWLIIWQAHQKK